MNIGENIKRYRLQKGMTQCDLAAAVGVSNQAVSKWECDGSIPDGLLLAPIADALGITIDSIFGRETTHERDVYGAIIRLLRGTHGDSRIEKAREVCWQIQKGLFGNPSFGTSQWEYEYEPDELRHVNASSYVNRDTGFTSISNRSELPFFSLFVEPTDGFGILQQYSGKFRALFEALGDEYVMNAFFFLYSKPQGYMFEKDVLAQECGIPDHRLEDVMEKLGFIATPNEVVLNNEMRTVYATYQRHELIAMLALVTEFFYAKGKNSGYRLQADGRGAPYFRRG